MIQQYKEFKPTSWAIDNKTSIYMLAVILAIFGFISYSTIPKEQIPGNKTYIVSVNTMYPGTSPSDIENFITRPLEKKMKSIEDVKEITSNSVQDFSAIIVEFNTGTDLRKPNKGLRMPLTKQRMIYPMI